MNTSLLQETATSTSYPDAKTGAAYNMSGKKKEMHTPESRWMFVFLKFRI
jgi:hypothetical protein